MKKFSNISKVEVGQEPKPVEPSKQEVEINEFKLEVMKLIDELLSIRSYGVSRPEIMIPTKIVGKEMFVEALTDLLTKKSNKAQVKALESLKSTNKDWKSIEEKIESIENNNFDIKEVKKINDIIEKWGSDESNLSFFLESYVNRFDVEEAKNKYQIVEKMNKNNDPLLNLISEKFLERSKV